MAYNLNRNDYDNSHGYTAANSEDALSHIIKHCGSPPPLTHISLTRIAISLWEHHDIKKHISTSCKFFKHSEFFSFVLKHREKWSEVEKKVLEKVPSLTLPEQYKKILNQIINTVGEQLINFLHFRLCSDSKNIHILLNNLQWTVYGAVATVRTVTPLLEHPKLSLVEKYELACSICLEDRIQKFLKRLSADFVDRFAMKRRFRLMTFWALHIRGDNRRLRDLRKGEFKSAASDSLFIFENVFDTRNEVAMHYIMDNFPDAGIQNYLPNLAGKALLDNSSTIILFILTRMNQEQISEFCEKYGYSLIKRFAEDWRFRSFFIPTATYILQHTRIRNVMDGVRAILLCWNEKVLEDEKCRDYLKKYVTYYVNDVEEKSNNNFERFCETLIYPLFMLEDVDTVYFLLTKGTKPHKRQMMYSEFGLKECSKLILNDRISFVEKFMELMLKDSCEIEKFKKYFLENNSFEIACSLVMQAEYTLLNKFLKVFCSESDIVKHKRELAFKERGKIIGLILKSTTYMFNNQLKAIDEFLYWSFDGDVMKMSHCKLELFDNKESIFMDRHHQFLQQIFELSLKGDLRMVEIYLKWAFHSNNRILRIKDLFFERRSFEISCGMITKGKYQLLDKFLDIFCAQNEIDTFKYSLPVAREGKIIQEILSLETEKNANQALEEFLNYSFKENDEVISRVKESIIVQGKDIDTDCRDIFLLKVSELMKSGEWQLVDKFMKWAFSVEDSISTEVATPPSPVKKPAVPPEKTLDRPFRAQRLAERAFNLERQNSNRFYLHVRGNRRYRPTQ